MLSIRSPYFYACRTQRKLFLAIATLFFTSLLSLPASAYDAVDYQYDHLGRLIQALYNDGTGLIRIDYTYDDAGNRTQKIVAIVLPA
jgi:hypothetical protein